MGRILVTYFSATGRTKRLAEEISKEFNLDIYEIKPKELYTDKDLNWMNPLSRSSKEHRNKKLMPELENNNANISEYDEIIICYPVWWYVAPNIVNSFLKSYDFSNKEIILFATSGGSGFGKAAETLKQYVDGTCTIKEGAVNPDLNEIKSIMKDAI